MRIACLRLMLLGALLAGGLLRTAAASADPGIGAAATAPAVGIVTATILEPQLLSGGDDDAAGAGMITLAVNLLYFPPGTALDVYVAGTDAAGEPRSFALLGTATADGKGGATLIGAAGVVGSETLMVRAVPAGGSAMAPVAWWTGTAAA